MKRLGFVRRVDETVKLLIAEDGRKLGCPFCGGEPCGTWCALFDVVMMGMGMGSEGVEARKVARCGATNLGELVEDTVPRGRLKGVEEEEGEGEDKTVLCTKLDG